MTLMMQINLRSEKPEGNAIMTTWVDFDKQLKVGDEVKLKGSDNWWRVTEIYENLMEKDIIDLNRGWTNNI